MTKENVPQESQVKKDPQWADRVERILRQWLFEQPYSTKLAFVLLNGCRLADDHTQAVFRQISEQYKAEVIQAAEELPGTLVNIEVFLTGVAADMLHSEERMFESLDKDESGEDDVAKPDGEPDEDKSEPDPSETDNSNKSVDSEPTNASDESR